MLDIHSHIIPEIDDGSKSAEMSIEMLKMAAYDGTKNIIATPHYYTGYYVKEYQYIEKYTAFLNKMAKEQGLDINVLPGQEVFIDNHTLDNLNNGIIGTLNNSKYMLVEFEMDKFNESSMDILYELRLRGIEPIIAHPERYMYVVENPSFLNKFIEESYAFQINCGSITGIFGKRVANTADILIQQGACSFVASDAHSLNKRSPRMSMALNMVKEKNEMGYRTILNNYEALLNNQNLYINSEKIKEKRRFFGLFK